MPTLAAQALRHCFTAIRQANLLDAVAASRQLAPRCAGGCKPHQTPGAIEMTALLFFGRYRGAKRPVLWRWRFCYGQPKRETPLFCWAALPPFRSVLGGACLFFSLPWGPVDSYAPDIAGDELSETAGQKEPSRPPLSLRCQPAHSQAATSTGSVESSLATSAKTPATLFMSWGARNLASSRTRRAKFA